MSDNMPDKVWIKRYSGFPKLYHGVPEEPDWEEREQYIKQSLLDELRELRDSYKGTFFIKGSAAEKMYETITSLIERIDK